MTSLFKKKERNIKNPPLEIKNIVKVKEDNSLNNKYFCCPKCKEKISISLNSDNFSLSYNCKNNHKESNINFNNFYNNKIYINHQPEIFCQQCKNEKLENNNILICNTCNIHLCISCILKHKSIYSHGNFGMIDNSINKCSQHNIDISQYCKTCKKNLCVFCLKKYDNRNNHNNHEIINFSDLIPDKKEIEKNNEKLDNKILKNNSIINKLKKWKEEMLSLIDETINNLNSEIMINKMIIQNFNWKFLDYTNYLNYINTIENLDKKNEKLENFLKSKMFIEQTKALTNYLFGEKYDNSNNQYLKDNGKSNENFNIIIEEDKKEKYNGNINNIDNNNINNSNYIISRNSNLNENIEKNIDDPKINILEILNNENALLFGKNNIYSYSLNNNNFKKLYNYEIKEIKEINNKNESLHLIKDNNKKIYHNLINLKKSMIDKSNDYNILIWKIENDLEKDKIYNLINNENKVINNKENENDKKELIKIIENKEIKNNQEDYQNNNENNNKTEYNENEIKNNEDQEKYQENKKQNNQIDNNKPLEYISKTINNINTNNNSIQISERSRFTNYNNINSNKNDNDNDNDNNNENNHESSGHLLFSNNNSNNLFSNYNNNSNNLLSNYNNNRFDNLFNSTNENTYTNSYNNLDSISNILSNNLRNERVKETYVFVSATGKKYHGRPQCGRMKTSRKVTLSNAAAMGLGPCLKCY